MEDDRYGKPVTNPHHDRDLPGWIHWPVRVVAVAVVLPGRLLWEALQATGRFLERYVGRPLAWLWHHAVVVPLSWLWRRLIVVPGSWVWRWLIVVPLSWVWRTLIVPPVSWAWRRLIVVPVAWLVKWLIVVPVVRLAEVTAPLWRALGRALRRAGGLVARAVAAVALAAYRWVLRPGWRGAGWVLGQVYRWLLRPAGRAIAWVWRHTAVPAGRAVAAAGRWVGDAVLRPAADAARAVLESVGLRRSGGA